jgi:5-methylcytosine-specific restriction endonuclease McrA
MRKKRTGLKKKPRSDTSSKARKTAKRKSKRVTVARTRNGKTMTEAQFWQKIRHALRNSFRWWKPMMIALEQASRPSQSANKRLKKEYQCAQCSNWFPRTQVEIDHKIPCGSLNCYEDISQFIKNLTPEDPNSFQILCKRDHKIKTDKEKEERIQLKKQLV